jgi:ABC-2 type transport system permease protein
MGGELRYYAGLYVRLMGAQLRGQMQYRASFIAELIGNFMITALDFALVAILLVRFRAIGGWTLAEVVFLFGSSSISLALAELFVGSFDNFEQWVVRGDFDRVLQRPLPVVYQMITGSLALRRFGRMAQGAIALGIALVLLRPGWDVGHVLFFGVMLVGGAIFFMAIFILGATLSFWSPQSAELANIFTYGGQFMTSYPMHIYEAWMRSLFTFVIPMAFINYYPALYLLGKPDPVGLPGWVPFLAPVVALLVFGVAVRVWRFGVRHYQSTGS